MNSDVLSSTSKLKIAGGSGGSGGIGGEGGPCSHGCSYSPDPHGGHGGDGKGGSSGLPGTIIVRTSSGDDVVKSDVGYHEIDLLYKPRSRECYKLMYTFNTFEFEDGDGVPHSISLNVGNTMSLLDARSLGLAPLPTMRSHISSSASSKFEKVSFEDTGDQNGLVDKTFTHSFAGDVGYKVVLTGWTHTRKYHKGYLRNTQGIGRAVVKGLDPSSSYDFRIYQYATSYAGTNSYSVQGRAMGSTTTSTDSNPTATGTTTSNNKGEIDFMFYRIAHHVALSGLSLKLNMPLLSECEGNCKEDKDCVDNLKCFKRTADVTSPVPGCTRGGPMDKPDFNYCYNPVPTNVVDELSFRIEDQCTNRALVSTGSLLGK
jgi:hypothetical protein